MLTVPERIIFIIMAVVFGGMTAVGFYGIFNIVRNGRPAPPLKDLPGKIAKAPD